MDSVLKELKLSSDAICSGMPSNDTSQTNAQSTSTKTIKVEKELKPDDKLEESDTLDTYNSWIAQFKTYFELSNFKLASPEARRIFLAKCLDES